MRILQVILYFNQKRGGNVDVCYNLIRALKTQGHEVTLLTTSFEYDCDYARQLNIKVVTVPILMRSGLFLYSPTIRKWLRQNVADFDVIHIHDFRTFQGVVTGREARKKGIPYILQAHGSAAVVEQRHLSKRLFDLIWGRRLLSGAERLVAVSENEVHHYIALGSTIDKIVIIPNCVNPDRAKGKPGNFRSSLGIDDSKKIVLYVGRVSPQKGLVELVHSFHNLLQKRNDLFLVIVGPDAGFEQDLRTLISSLGLEHSVRHAGFMRNPADAYVDADVLAYPSRNEIFGLVPFEAVMSGSPVVVSIDSGCGRLIAQEACGLTVRPGDIMDLQEKLELALGGGQEIDDMVERGKRFASAHLCWDTVVKEFERVYENSIHHS